MIELNHKWKSVHFVGSYYVHTYIPACIHTYIPPCMHTYIHTCMHAYIHTCMHAYIHTYIHTCMHACIHTHTHTHTHTYIHTKCFYWAITYTVEIPFCCRFCCLQSTVTPFLQDPSGLGHIAWCTVRSGCYWIHDYIIIGPSPIAQALFSRIVRFFTWSVLALSTSLPRVYLFLPKSFPFLKYLHVNHLSLRSHCIYWLHM
jgi:hypothetical protein